MPKPSSATRFRHAARSLWGPQPARRVSNSRSAAHADDSVLFGRINVLLGWIIVLSRIDRNGRISHMTTTARFPSLCRSLLRTSSVVLGLALCASAWANSGEKNVVSEKPQTATKTAKVKRVQYYVHSSASAIPTPIEHLMGAYPTTTRPMIIVGRRTLLER